MADSLIRACLLRMGNGKENKEEVLKLGDTSFLAEVDAERVNVLQYPQVREKMLSKIQASTHEDEDLM